MQMGVPLVKRYRFENKITMIACLCGTCPCGGIGRRVGLKIRSGLNLGASSSLAKGNLKRLTKVSLFLLLEVLYE